MKSSGGKSRKAKGTGPTGSAPKGVAYRQSATKPRPQFANAPRAADIESPRKSSTRSEAAAPKRVLARRSGLRPREQTGLILETSPSSDYALLDSGNGLKLEQYGPYRIVRPEGQAIWLPAWDRAEWDKADAVFTGNTDEEGVGRWNFPKVPLGETWPLSYDGLPFLGRFTSFRHVGVFPEQGTHWSYMDQLIRNAKRPVKVLNLFGYTGVASLVAARAGAEVTHVDASKKAIVWARENQEMAGLSSKPIRWICEDAMKFVAREERRGSVYDIILLDPPAYGRGPNGEVWQLFDNLPDIVDICRSILTPNPLAVVLTAYSIRASFFAIHELMRDAFTGLGGEVQSGELILRERSASRALSTSLFSRWSAQ
ncbi:class I SAM-dependent methyltransferase [Phyllobacterium endophyticum]|uniref:class I SAM-dependent methyltransferase n=1 Tax=Phyllobacterium endophyticum TaxID=1149773 RepID=UPI0031BAF568